MQEKGVKCWLKSIFNWFHKDSETTKLKGKFRCRKQECNLIFKVSIINDSNGQLSIITIWNGESNHEKYNFKKRIVGQERRNISYELVAKGTSNLISENIISNESFDTG